MTHAGAWFDDWQQDCYKTADSLNTESYQNLFIQCEVWVREKGFTADGKDRCAMEGGNKNVTKNKYFLE